MLGGEGAAGLPAALFTLGSALAAFTVGRVSQRSGRRLGLAGGFIVGALGAAGIVLAAALDNPILFVTALLRLRIGNGHQPAGSLRRHRPGPAPLSWHRGVDRDGVDHSRCRRRARQIAHDRQLTVASAPENAEVESIEPFVGSPRAVALGATIMVLTQIAMVAIMTMTPVHMRHHHHSLGDVGFVTGMHIGAMFLPPLVTGRLVDRIGRVPMAIASAVTRAADHHRAWSRADPGGAFRPYPSRLRTLLPAEAAG